MRLIRSTLQPVIERSEPPPDGGSWAGYIPRTFVADVNGSLYVELEDNDFSRNGSDILWQQIDEQLDNDLFKVTQWHIEGMLVDYRNAKFALRLSVKKFDCLIPIC